MVGKYAYSRGDIHSLTKNAIMVGLPSILRVEFRGLIRCYMGGLYSTVKLDEKHRKSNNLKFAGFFFSNFVPSVSEDYLP